MSAKKEQSENTWQGDFIQLMEQLSEPTRQPYPEVGSTTKELIYTENKLQLFRYNALDIKQKRTPILITYALVNRPYIVDLEPERSLVMRLLEKGYPVYLVDWGYPDSTDCFTSLNDYINGYLYRCIQQVKRDSKRKKIDLLGICQGGVFSLCYSALHPGDVRKLATLVTPVDFHTGNNTLSHWANEVDTALLNNHAGNVSGQLISQLFKTIKPFQINREKFRKIEPLLTKKGGLDTFLRMEKWLNDNPDLAGLAAQEFVVNFYQQNRLHQQTLSIGGAVVDMTKIKSPVLNLYATKDHIVPASSTRALGQHIKPALYQEHALHGGHIGAFISLKTQRDLINRLNEWLA
ncbi:MAG: alpha/beta fold hydrolase [Cycloclasticus sp.]|jgi:polyhydroxyalkanoate synthase|nr:alpha/beta fold hydrolase [Cycloclasticus sp.]MEE4290344.1 alpha/beta fold hydrolase [Cycloclasticus sp.]